MKKYVFLLALTGIIACKDTPKATALPVEQQTTETPNPKQKETSKATITKAKAPLDLEQEVNNFISCKANAVERSNCRNTLTKIITKHFGLTEFNDPKLGYKIYDSIQPIVKRSSKWKTLGEVNQKNIDKAIAHTKNGGLALVVDTSQTYGHVVMLVKGKAVPSGSWGMTLPKVLSLANHKPEASFHDKSLAYALKKSDALQIYIRK